MSSMAKRKADAMGASASTAAEGASASASTEAPSTLPKNFPSVESPPTSTVESGGVRGVSADAAWAEWRGVSVDAAWAEWLNTSPMDYKSRMAAIKAEVKRLKKEAADSQMRAIEGKQKYQRLEIEADMLWRVLVAERERQRESERQRMRQQS